ncbi:MAG TPA: hypothetical protein VLD39_07140, partial [Gammaproteobacteria bacterium]|nr:hypothetical protein [Gammaproteobacteria bacterium]
KLGTAVAASTSATPPEQPDAVSWIRHLGVPYSFGAMPLDDIRALEFESLFDELEQSGYVGDVVVGVHAGRFCMNYDTQGSLQIASPRQPALTCEEIGVPTSIEASAQQSIGFANMVAPATRNGLLRIETVSYGISQPLVDYPLLSYTVTAGDWNAIAARNQRITIQLPGQAPSKEVWR